MIEIWGDPLTWIGVGLMVIVMLVITIDILIVPTMIMTIVTLVGWFVYVIYVYRRSSDIGVFLGVLFLVLGSIYLFVIVKLKIWKWVAQDKKVPHPTDDFKKEIELFNRGEVIAYTDLRPVGKIRAEGETLDGLSEIGFIPKGTRLIITEYVEGQYKVKKK